MEKKELKRETIISVPAHVGTLTITERNQKEQLLITIRTDGNSKDIIVNKEDLLNAINFYP